MKRKSRKRIVAQPKFYSELPPDELDKMAAKFDREFVPTKPLTPAMRHQERRVKRKRGRPVVGAGAEKVLVTIERELLRDADAFAKKHHLNRSQLIAQGLLRIIRSEGTRRAS